ncbi:MAG: nucleotidyltransferase domain-containing protein [Chloroflexota bacterium]|nr:nucleotidyltransferase domain-containing protein [Chloroflexota bacterium]MDE2961869.1 nucleotidyltransferase domain-containing protein [Chloroflexota bacterium]
MTLATQTGVIRGNQRMLPGEPDPDAVAVAWSVYERVRPLQAYLFGSRARGNYDNHSDIDLAIITAKPVPEYLRLTIDRIAEQAATTLHPSAPSTDVSFLTVTEFLAGRVKKNTLANSVAKEGKLIMNGDAAGRDAAFEEEPVNWDDVDARVKSAQEAVLSLEILAGSGRSPERMLGYAAQQALEHAYKALIAAHGEVYPTGGRDGHNLRILIGRIQEVLGQDFQVPGMNWQSLTAYAGSGRYADDQPPLGDMQRLHTEISAAVADIIGHIPQRDQP